jgi:hypothetical protein
MKGRKEVNIPQSDKKLYVEQNLRFELAEDASSFIITSVYHYMVSNPPIVKGISECMYCVVRKKSVQRGLHQQIGLKYGEGIWLNTGENLELCKSFIDYD